MREPTDADLRWWAELINTHESATDAYWREQRARALLCIGHTLKQQGRPADAIVAWDCLARYRDSPEPELKRLVTSALVRKVRTLTELGRRREALVASRELADRVLPKRRTVVRRLFARVMAIVAWLPIPQRLWGQVEASLRLRWPESFADFE